MQRSALVGRLEILHHHLSYILLASRLVVVLDAAGAVNAITHAHARPILKDIVIVHLQQMVLVDVPSQLHCHLSQVVAVNPVLHGVVLIVVLVAQRQDNL